MANQVPMREILETRGISNELSARLEECGYQISNTSLYGMGEPTLCISDTFYGSKWGIGLIPIEEFFREHSFKIRPPVYEVGSLQEIRALLSEAPHSRYDGRMTFRGQVKEYFTRRSYPNPIAENCGQERLILPGYWRKFVGRWNDRFDAPSYSSIFATCAGDDLIYRGIEDWRGLSERNFKRYGLHTMSNLEDFLDPESQAYFKRWQAFKVNGMFMRDLPVVEQHYGFDTTGLDVTFNVEMATFFASHKFKMRSDVTAYYE